jgi:hypothetical protein
MNTYNNQHCTIPLTLQHSFSYILLLKYLIPLCDK